MFDLDDSLRICPKCKANVKLDGEERRPCPECNRDVWFFNYRKLPTFPEVPIPPANDLWRNPQTTALLIVTAIFGLAGILAIYNSAIVAVVCTFGAIGFAVFGFMRHAETVEAERVAAHYAQLTAVTGILHGRCLELSQRYQSLLQTGDARIRTYFHKFDAECRRKRTEADTEIANCRADSSRLITAADERERRAIQTAKVAQQSEDFMRRECVLKTEGIELRIQAVAARIVADNLKWVSNKLKADPESYQRQRDTLAKTFDFVESIGYRLPAGTKTEAIEGLRAAYGDKVREQNLKDEQRRIRQQAIEEARDIQLREQREQEAREAEQREAEIAELLAAAIAEKEGTHSSEIEELKLLLAEAEARSERAKSLAQITKVGHVYILSNIGSFGENLFKVGMTRREDPQDRVRELGDASVPFPFDVHAMISCTDAPSLENNLHRELTRFRVNRVNLRKEYFAVELKCILEAVEKHHGIVEYVAEPEALQFRESQNISPDDLVSFTEELAQIGVNLNEDDDLEAN